MTARERQILQWIEEDPLISQEALAKKAGITRSSVGVHVSNLMKKGYLAGRGYVLGKQADAAVVGGVNVDIGGQPFGRLLPRDSNPGAVRTALGGVGRNIAHNLALLGARVRLVTAFGDDENAAKLEKSCQALGVDTGASGHFPGERTSTYLYIADETGDMALAVADMEIYRHLTPAFLSSRLQQVNAARVAVADTNIPAESLRFLSEKLTVPLFVDPVSAAKAKKLTGCLAGIHTLKPNLVEASLLSGVEIRETRDAAAAAEALLRKGVGRVFLSLGAEGVYAADGRHAGFFPPVPAQVVNTTGAGDAFMAGLVCAYLDGLNFEDTVRFASAAAAVAAESEQTIAPDMSVERVRAALCAAETGCAGTRAHGTGTEN